MLRVPADEPWHDEYLICPDCDGTEAIPFDHCDHCDTLTPDMDLRLYVSREHRGCWLCVECMDEMFGIVNEEWTVRNHETIGKRINALPKEGER